MVAWRVSARSSQIVFRFMKKDEWCLVLPEQTWEGGDATEVNKSEFT